MSDPCLGVPVEVHYLRPDLSGRLRLGSTWYVQPSDELIYSLYDGFGVPNVRLNYGD